MKDDTPYQPSNGTEGVLFYDSFCDKCEIDRKYRETLDGKDSCPILPLTMIYDPGDPEYPKEWIYKNNEPTCISFILELTEEQKEKKRFAENQKHLENQGQLVLFDKPQRHMIDCNSHVK